MEIRTVEELRKSIAELPGDTPVYTLWTDAIEIHIRAPDSLWGGMKWGRPLDVVIAGAGDTLIAQMVEG